MTTWTGNGMMVAQSLSIFTPNMALMLVGLWHSLSAFAMYGRFRLH